MAFVSQSTSAQLFTVQLEGFLKDRRYTDFVLKVDPRRKIQRILKDNLEPWVFKIQDAYIKAGAQGITSELINNITYNAEVGRTGIYNAAIFIDENKVPYANAIESGRKAAFPPWQPIEDWARIKFGYSGRELYLFTRYVVQKLGTIGFDGNQAPYHIFKSFEPIMAREATQDLIDDLGLYIAYEFNKS